MRTTITGVRLAEANFVDLVTYRRTGVPVSTPVMSTPRGRTLLVRTHHTAGKLKRIRNNQAVEVTPRDSHGRPIGTTERGTARILPEAENAECLELLHRRHGLIGRASTWIRHRFGRDVFIEIEIA